MLRKLIQLGYLIGTNLHFRGFLRQPYLYQGKFKHTCVPVLQCYSCPGTQYGCPIGAIQNSFATETKSFTFYVFGFLILIGALVGKMTCGWLCPFGFLQDVMYKLTHWKKYTLSAIRIPKIFNYTKYIVLIVLVVGMPIALQEEDIGGSPWFCKVLCPAGTFGAGIPRITIDSDVRPLVLTNDKEYPLPINLGFISIGKYFFIKTTILLILLAMFLFIRRPFCRFLCPLGAIYGVMNKFSIFKMDVSDKCISCDKCYKACPMEIKIYENPQHENCIRCLDCIKECPVDAISWNISGFQPKKALTKDV